MLDANGALAGKPMPRLVRLYLFSMALGFGLALVFTLLLLAVDVGGLRHLALHSAGGWLAIAMLVLFHGLLFSGVQFAIRVMALGMGTHGGGRGLRDNSANGPAGASNRATAPAPHPAPHKA